MPIARITANNLKVAGWLDKKALKQMQFAQVVALNRTARLVKEGELQVMRSRFDRPTPYTMNSLYTLPARKAQAVAEAKVYFRDSTFKGTPATKYLKPEVYGGGRSHKRFERALINRGLMKRSQYAVPAAGARLDSYGNVSRGQIVQVLSALRAFGEQGYQANRTKSKRSQRKGAKSRYFVGNPGGEGEGVWQRVRSAFGEGVKPIFIFAQAPRYRVRVPFEKIAENITKARLPREFERAFADAMRTAR